MIGLLCGLDEAGRGPIAGPVVAAAVILPPDFPLEILGDSKKLSEKKRNYAEAVIKEKACWGIGAADHKTIDEINILQASLLSMSHAFSAMMRKFPDWAALHNFSEYEIVALADGNQVPQIPCNCRAEPKADANYHPVMAASILAKTCRDRIMVVFDKKYPEYGYAKHKGYPTAEHRRICHEIGVSPIQRLSFRF